MFLTGPLIEGLTDAMADLDVEPDVIEQVKKELFESARALDQGDFRRIQLTGSAFGGSERGSELGFHHGKAHQIVADTIQGVINDLRDFRAGVVRAVDLVEEADGNSAADLSRRAAAVTLLAGATRHSDGDRRNRESRNEHLGPGSLQGSEA